MLLGFEEYKKFISSVKPDVETREINFIFLSNREVFCSFNK